MELKSLFYSKIMFIETAVKNYALECILEIDKSDSISDFFDKAVCGYNNMGRVNTPDKKKKAQPLAKLSFLVTRAGIEPTLTA